MDHNPLVIVISGPSGVGKDATIAMIRESGAGFHYVVTATTRPRRQGEKEGVDYYFMSQEDFAKRVANDEFLEYAEVYGNSYGVLRDEVRRALQKGEDVVLKVDVQGAETLKRKIPDAVFIFLVPSRLEDLATRLKRRNADSGEALEIRIDRAEKEMNRALMFDYRVVNSEDNIGRTAEIVRAIATAERCRVKQRNITV
jgi:guanylate kinase